MNLDRVATHLLAPAVARLLDPAARQDPPRTLHQHLQDCELLGRQFHHHAAPRERLAQRAQPQAGSTSPPRHRLPLWRRAARLTLELALAITLLGLASPAAQADDRLLPSLRSRIAPQDLQRPPGVPDDATLEAAGARIGEVRLNRHNVFDLSVPEEDTALFRFANWLHVQTRERTLATQLLFKPGDLYDTRLLQESERLLRTNRFLRDARIVPVAYHDGLVDLEVITQDVWTLNPGVSFGRQGGANSSGIGLSELNLLGMGSELSIAANSNVDRKSRTLLYRDRQLAGTWWGLSTLYSSNSDGQAHEFTIDHPFYALDTRWAAGFSSKSSQSAESRYQLGQAVDTFNLSQRNQTVYAGRSEGLVDGWTTRWTVGLSRDEHRVDPIASPGGSGVAPDHRRLTYPWLGIERVEDDFLKTRNQDQIGKTEDYSLGWQVRARIGIAATGFGSDRDAVIFDTRVSKGFRDTPEQTLLLAAVASGRLENGHLEGALFSASGRYYLRRSPNVSSFLGLWVDRGTGLDADQALQLGGDTGLRGYPLRYQTGNGRWLFTAEQRAFTDWYPWRLFNVGGAVFYDMGRTWGGHSPGEPSQGLLRDLGFGLRLGNSRSALGNVVHIDLAFPLDGDPSIRKVQFIVETRRSF